MHESLFCNGVGTAALPGQQNILIGLRRPDEEKVRATDDVGTDVVKVSAMSREVKYVTPLAIGPPVLYQLLYLVMRTSFTMYDTLYVITIP